MIFDIHIDIHVIINSLFYGHATTDSCSTCRKFVSNETGQRSQGFRRNLYAQDWQSNYILLRKKKFKETLTSCTEKTNILHTALLIVIIKFLTE